MEYLLWRTEYETGDETVDVQHQQLFALVNELTEAVENGTGRDAVTHALIGFRRIARTHFGSEEALMERLGCPDREAHALSHRAIESDVEQMTASAENLSAFDLSVFAHDRLVGHTMKWDMPMIEFIRSEDSGGETLAEWGLRGP